MIGDAGSGLPPAPLPATAEEWRPYLSEYSDWYLRISGLTVEDAIPLLGLPTAEQISARWLGYEPATGEMIATAEERLGVSLPPSLRGFLMASNGWGAAVSQQADAILSCGEIDWFRNTHPGFFPDAHEPIDPEERDLWAFFARCLNVSQGGDAFLLDTGEVSANGEYSTYLFTVKYGALDDPSESFSELIALGREQLREELAES
jgi:hypothetical protein